MSLTLQRQNEYQLVTPKTRAESITITKKILMISVSEMMIQRKVFKHINYLEKKIFGVPVKIIQCNNAPEISLAFTLRLALEELKNGNLKEIKIILESGEKVAVEEYSLRFKYSSNDLVELEMSQGGVTLPSINSSGVKNEITNVLQNIKDFANKGIVHPLPDIAMVKVQVFYNNETPEYNEIFERKPKPEQVLKETCEKVKLGRLKSGFGGPLFVVRSSLLNEQLPTSEERMEID